MYAHTPIQILPVCNSWFDYVWAYFKVMVDVITEKVSGRYLWMYTYICIIMLHMYIALGDAINLCWMDCVPNAEVTQLFPIHWSDTGEHAC